MKTKVIKNPRLLYFNTVLWNKIPQRNKDTIPYTAVLYYEQNSMILVQKLNHKDIINRIYV